MKELDLEALSQVLGGMEPHCPAGQDVTSTVHPNGSALDGCE